MVLADHPAVSLLLPEGDREKMTPLVRATSVLAGLALRARLVLLAADGDPQHRDRRKGWHDSHHGDRLAARYEEADIEEPADHDRSCRHRRIDHRAIVAAALAPPPKKLGVTH